MSEKYHIVSLTPIQQAALKSILINYLKIQTKLLFTAPADPNRPLEYDRRYVKFSNIFTLYEEMAGMLPSYYSWKKSRPIVMYFGKLKMAFLLEACNMYERNASEVPADEVEPINSVYDKLKELLVQSNMYEFTVDEIKKAGMT